MLVIALGGLRVFDFILLAWSECPFSRLEVGRVLVGGFCSVVFEFEFLRCLIVAAFLIGKSKVILFT